MSAATGQVSVVVALGTAQTLAWGSTYAAPLVFALLLQRFGAFALLLSVALGLTGLTALLALATPTRAEHA